MKSRWSIQKTCSRIARWRFRNKVRHHHEWTTFWWRRLCPICAFVNGLVQLFSVAFFWNTCKQMQRRKLSKRIRWSWNRFRPHLRIVELPRSVCRSSIVQEYLSHYFWKKLLSKNNIKQVILSKNCWNARIRKRQLRSHPWCDYFSPLLLSIKSCLKSSHCQIWDPHVNKVKKHKRASCFHKTK